MQQPIKGSVSSYISRPSEDPESLLSFEDVEREGVDVFEGNPSQERLLDADFFNRFEDDFDEDDMKLA